MIGDHVKLTQKCASPRCFVSRFSEGLITFQNLVNRSTVPSSQTSQVAREQALRGALAAGREKEGELPTTSLEVDSASTLSMQNADWWR